MQDKTNNSPDVDLGAVKQMLKNYVSGVNDAFFNGILFIKRNIIILAVLFIGGAALGFYLDKDSKSYEHKILVTPNFESVDYLYEQVERLQAKIRERDSAYIKSLGIKDAMHLGTVKIEPVVDIYDFMDENKPDQSNNKIDLFKILSENGETDKILEDKTTSRNYKNHIITLTTSKKITEDELITPLLNSFNANPYWIQVQKAYQQNLEAKSAENQLMIEQINKLLGNYGSLQNSGSVTLYNDNTNIADLFNLKSMYLRELGRNKLNKIDYEKIVKDRGTLINIKEKTVLVTRMKVIIPVALILLFIIIVKFRDYYRRQISKRQGLYQA